MPRRPAVRRVGGRSSGGAYRVEISGETFASLGQRIIDAVWRHLEAEVDALATDSLRAWRAATPHVTGRLRRSEVAEVAIVGDNLELSFVVRPPGSAYYGEVAIRHPLLRGAKAALAYYDANVDAAINRAITRALEETS